MANHKFIFIHIPKTGGTSIVNSLVKKGLIIGHDVRNPNFKYLKNRNDRSNFIFTFVRNPWERLVSAFYWLNRENAGLDTVDKNKYIKKYNGDFNLFIKKGFLDDSLFNQMHFKPQYKWICDESDNLIVDFIGHFENLQKDFNVVCDKIGINQRKLPHQNKTDHKPFKEYYNKKTKNIIAEIYKKDIEYFGYKFDYSFPKKKKSKKRRKGSIKIFFKK